MSALVVVGVAAAGAAGAVLRFLAGKAFPARAGRVPLAVLVVNVAGSALGGTVLALAERAAVSPELSLVILTGVCGGLTTFSTWSVETIELMMEKHWRAAVLNVGSNLVLGIGAAALAYVLLR